MTIKKQASTLQLRFKGNPDSYTPSGGSAAPTISRSTTTGDSGNNCGSTMTCTFSPAPVSGVLLIAAVYDNTGVTPSAPTGGGAAWTEFSTGTSVRLWYKIANGAEPTGYNMTYSGVAKADATTFTMLEFTGNFSTPLDANSTTATSTTTCPTITTLQNFELALAFNMNTSIFALAAPASWTLVRSDLNGGISGCTNISIASQIMNAAGATGTAVWSATGTKVFTLGIRSI